MKSSSTATVTVICIFLWFFGVWGTVAYAVFALGHSGWWFLLALLITGGGVKIKGVN
jgi:hypothetical protein